MQFWKQKSLSEMTNEEWESLCDGCGKCCLNKIIDDDTDELYYTDVGCELLDSNTCQCKQYTKRFDFVPACTEITVKNIADLTWLPESCSYRRLYKGRDLPSWHPLLVGSKKEMNAKGLSVANRIVCETKVKYLEDHIVTWPLKDIE